MRPPAPFPTVQAVTAAAPSPSPLRLRPSLASPATVSVAHGTPGHIGRPPTPSARWARAGDGVGTVQESLAPTPTSPRRPACPSRPDNRHGRRPPRGGRPPACPAWPPAPGAWRRAGTARSARRDGGPAPMTRARPGGDAGRDRRWLRATMGRDAADVSAWSVAHRPLPFSAPRLPTARRCRHGLVGLGGGVAAGVRADRKRHGTAGET